MSHFGERPITRLGFRSTIGAPPPHGMSSPNCDLLGGEDCGDRALAGCGAAGSVSDGGASGGGAGFREKTAGPFAAGIGDTGRGGGAVSMV